MSDEVVRPSEELCVERYGRALGLHAAARSGPPLYRRLQRRAASNLNQVNRLNDANNAEGENLAGYQKGGEVDPHLHSLRRQGMLKLRESG
jgi:hypothetical protein